MFQIDDLIDITKDDIASLKNASIIPDSHPKLNEKFKSLLEYNEHSLTKKPLPEKLIKNINGVDLMNIRGYLQDYNEEDSTKIQNLKYFIKKDKIIRKKIDLTLHDLCNAFNKNDKETFFKEINGGKVVSIKIYDSYKNTIEKDKSIPLLKRVLKNIGKPEELSVLSIINTEDTHHFLKKLLDEKSNEDTLTIKYIQDSKTSYIPSLFYMLIKYRNNKDVYKNYLLYFEAETNWAVTSFVDRADFSKQFLKLLDMRFEKKLRDDNSIDFEKNIKEQVYEDDIDEIMNIMKNLLTIKPNKYKEYEKELINKINSLKITYPTIDIAHKFLYNVAENLFILRSITTSENRLPNTEIAIKKVLENNLSSNIKKVLFSTLNFSNIDEIDIIKLRKGVFVQTIHNNQALCDIFYQLKWDNINNILKSFNEIIYKEDYSNIFLESLGINYKKLSHEEKIKKCDQLINEYIVKGEKVKLV